MEDESTVPLPRTMTTPISVESPPRKLSKRASLGVSAPWCQNKTGMF